MKYSIMKYSIQINQLAIIENGFNIKGTNLDTWALLDFLVFCVKDHKTLNKNGIGYIWINYNYTKNALPLCNFTEQKIKKHLNLLERLGLIKLAEDSDNNVYYALKDKAGLTQGVLA